MVKFLNWRFFSTAILICYSFLISLNRLGFLLIALKGKKIFCPDFISSTNTNFDNFFFREDIFFLIHIRQLINEEGYTIKGVQMYLKKDNTLTKTLPNKEKEYFQIIKEIKKDIKNIINNK